MLENNSDNLKRFVHPQRNRSLSRRKSGDSDGAGLSGVQVNETYLDDSQCFLRAVDSRCTFTSDRFEKINYSHGIDGDKSQASIAKKFSSVDHGDIGSSYIQNESTHAGLVPLDGCSTSEAAQLLNERWATIMHSYNDPSIDLSERPIMYSGASGSSWGHLKLTHQMDFPAELRRAIHIAQTNIAPISRDHS